LYDLPGLVYKDDSITEKIKNIIKKYTFGKDTLIMLIVPATQDLTTSEALSLIRKNEDYQERTLAVVTKIDLAINEKGILNKITNHELKLRYPPFVVRNRNQDELDKNESITSIRQKEMKLIEGSELYNLANSSKGTDNLVVKLIELQKEILLRSKSSLKLELN